MNRTRFLRALQAGLVASALPLFAAAAQADPRGFAMGGTDAALARGADATLWNPAFLGLPGSPKVSMRLFQAGVRADNNSFTMDQYRRLNGAEWSQADKDEILSSVGDAWNLYAAGDGGAGVAVGPVGVYADGWGSGDAQMRRDGFDLVLNGNELGRLYDVTGSGGRGEATARLLLGFAVPLTRDRQGASSAGFQIGIERGIRWEEGTSLDATLQAATDTAQVMGDFLRREGTRGTGVSLGVGYARADAAGGRYSVAVRDLYSRINWTGTDQRYHLKGSHGVNGTGSLDSMFVSSTDPAVPAAFSTRRAPVLDVGVTRVHGPRTLSALFEKGLGESPGVSPQIRTAYGLEWRGLGPLALRGGISLGGGQGTWFSAGLGLHAGPASLDAAVGTHGLTPSHTRGLGVAIGSSIGI